MSKLVHRRMFIETVDICGSFVAKYPNKQTNILTIYCHHFKRRTNHFQVWLVSACERHSLAPGRLLVALWPSKQHNTRSRQKSCWDASSVSNWRRHSFNNIEGGRPPVLWPKEVGGLVSNDEMSSFGQMAKIRAGKMIIR